MIFDRKDLSNGQLVHLYKAFCTRASLKKKMLILLRQGKISKCSTVLVREAIGVGATLALQQDEWIMSMHRHLGVFTTRNLPLHKLFMQWEGMQDGYTRAGIGVFISAAGHTISAA